MLDEFVVFDRRGLVLFRRSFIALKGDPVGALIRTVLLETRESTSAALVVGQHAVKYALNNKAGLVLACVYQALLQPAYVEELLAAVLKALSRQFTAEQLAAATGPLPFDARFDKLLWEAEEAARRPRGGPAEPGSSSSSSGAAPGEGKGEGEGEGEGGASDASRRAKQRVPRAFQGKKKDGAAAAAAAAATDVVSAAASPRPSPKPSPKAAGGKEARSWTNELSAEAAAALDMSGKPAASAEQAAEADAERARQYMPESGDSRADIDASEDEQSGDDEEAWSFQKTGLGSLFASLTGQKPLTREELAPALDKLEKQLQAKNVSADAAREITEAVGKDLEGKKLGSMTRGIATAVRESCQAALERLLTPKRSIDILREARAAKAAGRPYSIVFIGVNGVGKSTSLSKVCYYLKQNGLKVMLCACDTFRSGAVEQLKVHARNLQVELFEQGYNKDAASVATNGIKHARDEGYDVVLVDTAGRMQNNEPLMRQLTRLISTNRPDLILFVGEALAGNDGRDQLVLFDKALVDYSNSPEPRRIDGMMLTKFDTIDDKVGAAVSMVHSSGQPIIFVGTGQKYTNLNRINVAKVVKALLS
jgi:signal recognition particle receptor subunit alpha